MRVLMVTSSFPRFEGDAAGAFLVPLVNMLSVHASVKVLAPSGPAVERRENVTHARYAPHGWERVFYGSGAPIALQQAPLRHGS